MTQCLDRREVRTDFGTDPELQVKRYYMIARLGARTAIAAAATSVAIEVGDHIAGWESSTTPVTLFAGGIAVLGGLFVSAAFSSLGNGEAAVIRAHNDS